jgi:transcription elongation factor GreA
MINLSEHSRRINSELEKQKKLLDDKLIEIDTDIKREQDKKNRAAEEGDLRENAGYITATENLARLELEMRNVYNKIEAFKKFRMEDYQPSEFIGIGTTVQLSTPEGQIYIYKLVPADLGDAEIGAVSINAPVGQAIIGKQKGDIVVVKTQAKTIDYEIEEVY